MNIRQSLAELEKLGLIQLTQIGSDPAYMFKHTLVQEAAYQSLLKENRKHLHRVVGEVLERAHPDRIEELAATLAAHFDMGEDPERARLYYLQAGELAMSRYALSEAIDHLTRGLNLEGAENTLHARLHRARGQAFEALGEFDHAQADMEKTLNIYQAAQDARAAWQAFIDLGFLWSGRDYQITGKYYHQAHQIAQQINDRSMLAHSLNWLGNYYLNIDQPIEAKRCHREALAIFEGSNDQLGMAETHDLLGMTGFLSGDLIQGRDNIGQAIVLFEKMDRLRSLSSSLAVLSGLGSHYQIETLVSPVERPDSLDSAERALKIAQDIGWRAGEAYALCLKSLILGPAGEFGFALETALIARELAREINHRQWLTFTNFSLGVLYHDILAYEASDAHLTTSLEISKEIGSFHWIRSTTGVLGTCLIEQQKLAKASTLLKAAVPEAEGGLYLTLGSRQIGCAQAELALAEGDPARALEVVSQLEATAANFVPGGGSPILRLEMLRGKAFFALGRLADAENALNSARQIAETLSARTHLWRILADLGAVYHQQGKLETSNLTRSEARGMIEKIAATIPDVAIQGVFLERSLRLIQ